jgi:membrane protein implicated in regulation of membrane protease activity
VSGTPVQRISRTMRLYEVTAAVCGTITFERRCYLQSYIFLPARQHCSDDGDTPGDRGGPDPRWDRTLYRRPGRNQPWLAHRGGIVTLLAGGLALLGAGVPYSGVLLSAIVVGAMVMGGVLFGVLGSLRGLRGKPALTGKEGMIGEVGTVRSPVGVNSEGWVFVHGELWRAVLAFAPEETHPRESEPTLDVGRKVSVVGFGDGGVVQVVPIELPGRGRDLDRPG